MVLLLKNKIAIISSLLFIVLLLVQCSNNNNKVEEKAKADSLASCIKPLNPNGDSELSILMREMVHSAESLKEMVKKGELPETFPEAFLKIHTAKPTDSETKKASFEGFANNYISNLHLLYNSPKEELTQNYNAVITACISCHGEHCPGPLGKINKLKIEN